MEDINRDGTIADMNFLADTDYKILYEKQLLINEQLRKENQCLKESIQAVLHIVHI